MPAHSVDTSLGLGGSDHHLVIEEQPAISMVPMIGSVPCADPVVISGISCRLPQSDNMQEFRDNLMNGVDMVTEDDSRWQPG